MSSLNLASNSLNEFSMKLHSKLAKPGENLFYSPTSIGIAVGMTYAGAKGTTAKEVEETMHWNTPEKVHEMMKDLQEALLPSSGGFMGMELKLANRLWAQSGFSTQKEFSEVLQRCYRAEMGVVDYQRKTEEARKAINGWVTEKTNAKIKELLGQSALSPATKLVLVNAIYFNGFWQNEFQELSTCDWNFKVDNSVTTKVKLMNKTAQYMYTRNESLSCQVVKLPYKMEKVAMMILLPDKIDGLPKLEEKLNASTIAQCNEIVKKKKVSISLPKFKVEYQCQLKEVLAGMGMHKLFSSTEADLSGITGNKDLFVSEVVHQAFVDVNEQGTEAAAATAVVCAPTCILADPPPHFLADHPFIFIIQDCESETILFIGRIVNPKC